MSLKEDLVRDHVGLQENRQARRYFAKFETILSHLPRVAADLEHRGRLTRLEVEVLGAHLRGLGHTFRALSHKYLMTGRDTGVFLGSLTVDRAASGFPVLQELLSMAADAGQAHDRLAGLPDAEALKDAMISAIVGERRIPTDLQYAMSQRLYLQELIESELFWPRNDVRLRVLPGDPPRLHLDWAVWDGGRNLPVIWTLEAEDTGRTPLAEDPTRWIRVRDHLMAQALPELKMVTVAKGIDDDFERFHPKRMTRVTVGPMYSQAYTRQTEGLGRVLAAAHAPAGQDWALSWTIEVLEAEREIEERSGWFSSVPKQIWRLPPGAQDTGATEIDRAAILSEPVYQAFAEMRPAGFTDVGLYVVGGDRLWREN